jgi:phosphonate transport system substrate-binding protein
MENSNLQKRLPVPSGKFIKLLFGFSCLLTVLLSACGLQDKFVKPTPTIPASFFSTPIPGPLGSTENPLVLGIVNPENDPSIQTAAQGLSEKLAAYTLLESKVVSYTDYQEMIDDLALGKAHILWLPPATYLGAHERGLATISLLSNHFGVYYYGSQFLANQASEFTRAFDSVSGKNNGTAEQSLAQFKDKRPCWVGTDSLSGYYVPLGLLNENKIPILPGAFLQNHPAVVRALYIRGICDFGVTFALLGDPRTASTVQNDLTDALDQIPVIYRTDGIIPNLGLAYSYNVPEDLRKNLDGFFLAAVRDDETRGMLSSALDYEVQDVQKVDDSVYDRLRELLKASGANLQSLVGW